MKTFVFLLSLLSLVFSQNNNPTVNELHGCIIKEQEGECCWMNNNGCCQPYTPGQICTQAFRKCCKIKKYDEETQTYTYTYY